MAKRKTKNERLAQEAISFVKSNPKYVYGKFKKNRFLDIPDHISKPIEKKERKLIPIEEWKKRQENNNQ